MEIRATSYAEVAYMSTIRLLAMKENGPEVASAFVIDDGHDSFVVTARHAVEDARSVTLHFYSGESGPDLGPAISYEIRDPSAFWIGHDDKDVDVAVGPLEEIEDFFEREERPFFASRISSEDFAPRWEQPAPSPFDGFRRPRALDEVLIVGYPNDYRDNPTSLPLLRRGVIATPLWLDHEGRPVFLVDTAASHGTSGGPVFCVEEKQKTGKMMYGDSGAVVLLGIFSEVLPPKTATAATGVIIKPPNLGAAYKAHTILEILARLRPAGEPKPD